MSEAVSRREPVEVRAAEVVDVDFPERTIEFIAAPYEKETVVPYRRDEMIREVVERSAFKDVQGQVTVNRDHDHRRVVGQVVKFRTDDPRGLVVEVRISKTALGDETLALAADGVLRASVGMVVPRSGQRVRNGLRRIKRAMLDHIALLPNPAYQDTPVLSVRDESARTEDEPFDRPTPNMDAIRDLLGEDF